MSNDEGISIEGTAEESAEFEEDTLYCWRDSARLCGMDCPAFDQRMFQDRAVFTPCLLLNNDRILATAFMRISQSMQHKSVSKVDAAAAVQQLDKAPPEVR